jgi:hypothetical protein
VLTSSFLFPGYVDPLLTGFVEAVQAVVSSGHTDFTDTRSEESEEACAELGDMSMDVDVPDEEMQVCLCLSHMGDINLGTYL